MQTPVSRVPPHSSAQVPQAAAPKPKLLDQVRLALRARHYSRRTEQTYCLWIKRFILQERRLSLALDGYERVIR